MHAGAADYRFPHSRPTQKVLPLAVATAELRYERQTYVAGQDESGCVNSFYNVVKKFTGFVGENDIRISDRVLLLGQIFHNERI